MVKHGLTTERVEVPVTPGGSNVGDSTPTTPYVAAMNDTEKVVRTMARTNAESDGAATTGNVAASQTLAKLDDLRKVCCVALLPLLCNTNTSSRICNYLPVGYIYIYI